MRHLQKSGIVTLQAIGGAIGSKTAPVTEKWEGDAEVKKTGEHAGKSVQQLKSELEGLKAKSKTYQDKNQPVPDAIKDQEHEIMFAIRAKQGWKKGEGAMGENVNEGVSPKDMDKIKAAVEAASSFMGVGVHLKKAGLKYTFATSPMPIYIVQPTPNNKVAIVNKKYASQPDFVHGEIAVGIMESVNESVNEASLSWKDVDKYANAISNLTQIDTKDVKKFIEDNKLNIEKIFAIAHKTSQGKTDFVKAIKAAPNSSIQNAYIKTYANEGVVKESVNEGKKVFKVNPGIGSSKYSISSHDGVKTHKDGSDFYDIKIFKNKVDLEKGIKDYKSKGFVEEGIENVANGLPQTMGKQKSLKREALKSIVKEVMQEEAEYQKFFQKVLDKAGKSIPSMSDDEKKAFFDKVDAAWKARGEKTENVNEAIDINYWKKYANGGGPLFSRKITTQSEFNKEMREIEFGYNNDPDSRENRLKGDKLKNVKKLAQEFFDKAGFITANIIDEMWSKAVK